MNYINNNDFDEFGNLVNYFYRDENGNLVNRTKEKYPYSYDFFVTYDNRSKVITNNTVYSDRMWEWDSVKYDKCTKEIWNDCRQVFFNSSPQDIEKFLQLYFNNGNLILTLIMEGCNQSSGYPLWRFDMGEKK